MSRTENPRNKVITVYPKAVCKQDVGKRLTAAYFVQPDGPVIAGGPTAVKAWSNSLLKLEELELKSRA